MLCILYVNVVGGLLGIAGLLIERVLPALIPRRWMWCGIIATTLVVPGVYQAKHKSSVIDVLERDAVRAPLEQAFGSTSLLDPEWWAHGATYADLITRTWIVASAALFLLGLTNVLRVSWLVNRARRDRNKASTIETVDGVPVVVTDSLGPATVGMWRSRVLVPKWVLALPRAQRQYIVRHEDEHRRTHDAGLLFVASLALLLTPWNIPLWWQLRRLRLAVEMDCDNRVVSALGNANAYGELLLKVAQVANSGPRLQPALLGGVGMLERRLRFLLAPASPANVQRLLLSAVAGALLLIVFTMPHPVSGRSSHAHSLAHAPATTAGHATHDVPSK